MIGTLDLAPLEESVLLPPELPESASAPLVPVGRGPEPLPFPLPVLAAGDDCATAKSVC